MKTHTSSFSPGTHEAIFPEQAQDAYTSGHKLGEPAVCSQCGAVYRNGRWTWEARPTDADNVICPACHRIADGMPAGYLYIEGHAALRREEMLGLLTHHEMRARGEHPLQRIITIEDEGHRMIITTTDVHLARDLAMALKGAFHGECKFKYSRGDQLLRAYWRR